ncbi:MAG: hypothetical protein MJH10_09685 [Epibacterium sp.]|nr:hypothetical protein [Epibacterium sp.]NQX73806.1 hypothetical protein [Epibacterium sp.]
MSKPDVKTIVGTLRHYAQFYREDHNALLAAADLIEQQERELVNARLHLELRRDECEKMQSAISPENSMYWRLDGKIKAFDQSIQALSRARELTTPDNAKDDDDE